MLFLVVLAAIFVVGGRAGPSLRGEFLDERHGVNLFAFIFC